MLLAGGVSLTSTRLEEFWSKVRIIDGIEVREAQKMVGEIRAVRARLATTMLTMVSETRRPTSLG
jgi:hypothetical protein